MKIPILLESCYRESIWCTQTLRGMYEAAGRKRYELAPLPGDRYAGEEYAPLLSGGARMAVIVGTGINWVAEATSFLAARGVRALLVGGRPESLRLPVSSVCMDHLGATNMLLDYLGALGKKRVAAYGINPNSAADVMKASCFLARGNVPADIFYNYASLDRCYLDFAARGAAYDAVLCAIDLAAVSLIRRLRAAGVRVPEDLFAVSFGDTYLARLTEPSLTSASLDHEEMGRQAVFLYGLLAKGAGGMTMTVTVNSRFTPRASTRALPPPASGKPRPADAPEVDFYRDDEVGALIALEDFLAALDEVDMRLLCGLMRGRSLEDLAERCHISDGTVKYRARRMAARAGREDRHDLVEWLRGRLSVEALEREAEAFISPDGRE